MRHSANHQPTITKRLGVKMKERMKEIVIEFDWEEVQRLVREDVDPRDVVGMVLQSFSLESGDIDEDEVEVVFKHGDWHLRIPLPSP